MTGAILGTAILLGLAAYAWRGQRRRLADERLAEIARAGLSRQRYPSVYSGPDTRYGLACGTPCRIRSHKQGNVTQIVTPDGNAWNVPGHLVARRTGRDTPARPGRRARKRASA